MPAPILPAFIREALDNFQREIDLLRARPKAFFDGLRCGLCMGLLVNEYPDAKGDPNVRCINHGCERYNKRYRAPMVPLEEL